MVLCLRQLFPSPGDERTNNYSRGYYGSCSNRSSSTKSNRASHRGEDWTGGGLTVSALGLLAPVGGWFYWRRRGQRPLLRQQGGDGAARYTFTKPELHAEEATAVADGKMET
jgi:hypothetical protein